MKSRLLKNKIMPYKIYAYLSGRVPVIFMTDKQLSCNKMTTQKVRHIFDQGNSVKKEAGTGEKNMSLSLMHII